jgi:hypothetical protein
MIPMRAAAGKQWDVRVRAGRAPIEDAGRSKPLECQSWSAGGPSLVEWAAQRPAGRTSATPAVIAALPRPFSVSNP